MYPETTQPSWLLGPLQSLVDDPAVTDVLVNGVDGVWVDRGEGLERVGVELGMHGHGPAFSKRRSSVSSNSRMLTGFVTNASKPARFGRG